MRTSPSSSGAGSRGGAGPGSRASAAPSGPVLTHLERDANTTAQNAMKPDQRRSSSGHPSSRAPAGPGQQDETRAGGDPLPLAELFGFSHALGHDFSQVRVHADSDGAEVAEQAGARAVARGEDLFFSEGEYDPDSAKGRELLAHELTHVAQQAELDDGAFAQTKPKEGEDKDAGIGRAPPEEPFEEAEGKAPEDDFVLFNKNSADPDLVNPKKINALIGAHEGPVDVELHGYASLEGEKPYNRNLAAHRAVAIKRVFGDLLPQGSDIRLFSHGETFAFGKDLNKNRRVGIKITPKPAAAAATTAAPGTTTSTTGVNTTGIGKNFGAGPALPPPWLIAPDPSLLALSGFRPDYFTLLSGARSHLQLPSERDFNSVMSQAERNYLFFQSILGPRGRLPLLGDASDLANLTASFAYDNQLSLESPNWMERQNREFEINARLNNPNFWQTPILKKTFTFDFP